MIYPLICIIEITRFCNYNCVMCPHKEIAIENQGNMSINTFMKIIDESCDFVKVYQLYWMGEPFLNPHIFDMIKYIRTKSNAVIVVSTNGSLLNSDLSKRIISSGIDKLIIDIDSGNNADIYSMIRCGGDFETVVKNVEDLILLNKENNIEIILQFLHFKINSEQLNIFMQRWKDKKCTLRIDWIDSWANQMPELIDMASEISPYADEERKPCADLWHRITINYKGEVNLCCHDYRGTIVFGNINKSNLIQIWNSDRLNKIRNNQNQGIYKELCENCIEWAKEFEYEEFLL